MKMDAFAFGTTRWADVEKTEHRRETGLAYGRARFFGEKPNQIRVRRVEYAPGYLARTQVLPSLASSAHDARILR